MYNVYINKYENDEGATVHLIAGHHVDRLSVSMKNSSMGVNSNGGR